ncbi:hypothetical protein SAMN04489730_4089 [Amycolatopsis australiensis]|uniref:N-acetyltransferase domain-containing protein n=1 Tax=Amycolatopsis australiensis TaxID=546364 RepID=A0A1K1RW32_9PSEU|nr:hypothetical protein SAMN04489730_4089 [Amycolatopsis australiensis]
MTEIEVRAARPGELAAVAELRWRWVTEQDGPPGDDRAEFVREFTRWARAHAESHRCLVLVRDDRVIGMAFLAITPRVPTPAAFTRAAGDVQSVYVVPEARDSGLGGRLIDGSFAWRPSWGWSASRCIRRPGRCGRTSDGGSRRRGSCCRRRSGGHDRRLGQGGVPAAARDADRQFLAAGRRQEQVGPGAAPPHQHAERAQRQDRHDRQQ